MKDNLKVDKSGLILIRAQHGFMDGYVISVPSNIFPGLCFAYHHRTSHPSKFQMFKLLSRYYYTTGMQTIIEKVTNSCLMCTSTKRLPKPLLSDTTTIPEGVGTSFSSDVLERLSQKILITKDELSHFATAVLIEDQTAENLRQGLIQSIAPYISETGAKVRVDSAPGFNSIAQQQDEDEIFKRLKLKVELGDPLNSNKNPNAEAAIAELKRELLNLGHSNCPIDQAALSLATHNMNTRVRAGGKTASERMMARDILTNKPITVDENVLKTELELRRKKQHLANTKQAPESAHDYTIGDMVMLKEMKRLDKARDLFIVADIVDDSIYIRRSEKQWRRQLYKVKPSQIIKVVDTLLPKVHQKKENIPKEPSRETHPLRTNRPLRSSKSKARFSIQQGYRHKITTVGRKKKKTNVRKFITISYNTSIPPNHVNNVIPNQDQDLSLPPPSPQSSCSSPPSSLLDSPNDDDPTTPLGRQNLPSLDEMITVNMLEYERSASCHQDLEWDHDRTLVNLHALNNSDDEDIFEDIFEDAIDDNLTQQLENIIEEHELNIRPLCFFL